MCSALKGSCEEEGPGVFASSHARGGDESSFWPGCLLQCFRPAAVPALYTPRAGGSDVADPEDEHAPSCRWYDPMSNIAVFDRVRAENVLVSASARVDRIM